jgi:hypothetical protein
MSRLRIPALVDVLRVSDPALIAALADDRRLDRNYVARGPLLNRIIAGRIRKVLMLGGLPLPPVAPHGDHRPTPAQAALEARLDPIAATLAPDDPAVEPVAAYVWGDGPYADAGRVAQQAVGLLFDPRYEANPASWAAAKVFDQAPRSFNPFLLIWWAITGAVPRARRLLAGKVGDDPSGLHGTGVAVHNIVAGLQRMRALWADPAARRRYSPEAAAAQCLIAPQQVVRQPMRAGLSIAGDFDDTTLVLLQLDAANTVSPSAEMAFMTQSWSRCPAHAWVPALLAAAWRGVQGHPDAF